MSQEVSDNKKIWAAHCERHYVPLYFQPWWMDCACSGSENWGICLSLDGGGHVEGALIFHLGKYFGMPVIKMPPFTTYSGLWLHPPGEQQKHSSRMAFEKRVCENLLAQLPPHVFFFQQWHPAITNWLPFYWKGFRQTTYYTYRLRLDAEQAVLLEGMNKSARKRIRKAASELSVETGSDPVEMFHFYEMSLKIQGLKPAFSLPLFAAMDTVLAARNQRKILLAKGKNGNVYAADYLIWDERATYSLLGGIHPGFRNTSGLYLLFWEALSKNFGNSVIFDFEGSILEPVEESLRSFGGELTPHFKIFRASNKLVRWASVLLNKDYY